MLALLVLLVRQQSLQLTQLQTSRKLCRRCPAATVAQPATLVAGGRAFAKAV
jgi:hypothetical protein